MEQLEEVTLLIMLLGIWAVLIIEFKFLMWYRRKLENEEKNKNNKNKKL